MARRRSRASALFSAAIIAILPPCAAIASGPQPTGTISCSLVAPGSSAPSKGITFRPFIDASPRNVRVGVINTESSCDDSAVTGATAPIVQVAVKFTGRMHPGTCTEFTTAPALDGGNLRLKWQGLNPAGHSFTVARSRAKLASASYDGSSDTFVVVTQPIATGAFLGATATLRLGLDEASLFKQACETHGSGFVEQPFGETNPSTIDVQ